MTKRDGVFLFLGFFVSPFGLLFLWLHVAPPLPILNRLLDISILTVSGCRVVDDGIVFIDNDTGHWLRWEKRVVGVADARSYLSQDVEQGQNYNYHDERVVRSKILYGCRSLRG